MRYLFLRENMLLMVNIRFHLPKPYWTPYDVYTKYVFIIGVSALTIVIRVQGLISTVHAYTAMYGLYRYVLP